MTKTPKTSRLTAKRKRSVGMTFGLLAGLLFALVAWGLDAILLWGAASTLPWLKFFLMLLFSTGLGALSGWLSARYGHMVLAFTLWMAFGLVVAWLGVRLPFEGLTYLVAVSNAAFRNLEVYPFAPALFPLVLWITLATGVLFGFVGLLEMTFLRLWDGSPLKARHWGLLLGAGLLVSLPGLWLDAAVNRPLRQPLSAMHRMLQASLDGEASSAQQDILQPMEKYLRGDYRLRQGAVNPQDVNESAVYVNFGNVWGSCFYAGGALDSCQLSLDRYVKPLICVLAGGMQHECGIQATPEALAQVAGVVQQIKGTDVSFEIFSQQGSVILVQITSNQEAAFMCVMREMGNITLQNCTALR